jgi:nucleotide-binding universal stress UspA family protein
MVRVPQSVLVPVDFGNASARAVAIGGAIADRCKAGAFRLLHAESMEAPVYFTPEQIGALKRESRALRSQAERFLAEFGGTQTKRPFSTEIAARAPVEAILHASVEADLVVMGTHGRHGPRRWWLGSVAERVLREIARPLLVVRAEMTAPVTALFDRAVVHAAPPLAGTAALDYAREVAACFGAAVIDRRHQLIEPAIEETQATILIVAVPEPRTTAWLSNFGEPLVRFCPVPLLFVPEIAEGASR